jgi:hypothetical protein
MSQLYRAAGDALDAVLRGRSTVKGAVHRSGLPPRMLPALQSLVTKALAQRVALEAAAALPCFAHLECGAALVMVSRPPW